MAFRLQYLAHDLELPLGDFVIGRSLECQLALDDPMVSRRHAVIEVRGNVAKLRDLGSRNGVTVNGARVADVAVLNDGDEISIGGAKLTLWKSEDTMRREAVFAVPRYQRATTGSMEVAEIQAASAPTSLGHVVVPPSQVPRLANTLGHLMAVADKALALGRAEEAERILSPILTQLLEEARVGQPLGAELAEQVGTYALRLAKATGAADWVNFVFELGVLDRWVFPAAIVDELHGALRKVRQPDMGLIRTYLDQVRRAATRAGPSQRFLIQRIESLVEVAASR
jgi:hypothetical protein